ncbi:SIMPL domain-containing protein [Kordiimonas sediminis]|nr:SIMPL domain-containing protein [Kordiimonas sediminis]
MKQLSAVGIGALIVFGLGMVGSGYFVGGGIYEAFAKDRQVTVKGLAEREVTADVAVWKISHRASHDTLADAKEKLKADTASIKSFLQENGLDPSGLTVNSYHIQDRVSDGYFNKDNKATRFTLTQTLLLQSTDVELVRAVSQKIADLPEKGVVLNGYNQPTYVFQGLNDIKPDMVAEATRAARESAQKFATDSGSELETILYANQGVVQILPLINTSELNANTEIHKKIRLVTTITYKLAD